MIDLWLSNTTTCRVKAAVAGSMSSEALRPGQPEQDPWQGVHVGAASPQSLRAEWQGVTSRALSRISATPDNDVLPMDPELVNQMQNLCHRLGLAVSSDPEALLEHLVTWGHKVLDHQDHLQHQLDVLKHDIMSPARSAGGSSAASASSRASSRSSTASARSSVDGSGPKPNPGRAAGEASKGGARSSSVRSTAAAAAPTPASAFAAAAATGATSTSAGPATGVVRAAPGAASIGPLGSSSGTGRRFNSGIDAELQQWLQQLDEVWQLQGASSVAGSRRSSGSEAGAGPPPAAATSAPAAAAAAAAGGGGGGGGEAGPGSTSGVSRQQRQPSLEGTGGSSTPVQPLLLPEAGVGLKGVLPFAPGGNSSGASAAAYAQQVTPRALSPAVLGVTAAAAAGGLRTPAAPITPGANDATHQAIRARSPGLPEEASSAAFGSRTSSGPQDMVAAASATVSLDPPQELSEPSPMAQGFPGRALWPAAAAAAVSSPALPLLGAASGSSTLGSPVTGYRILGRNLSSPELGVGAASPGRPLLPRGSMAASAALPPARSVPGMGRPPVAPPGMGLGNRDGLGLLLQPWQPPQHQVPPPVALPQPVIVANAGAAWMPTDTAAAARTAAMTAHLRRGAAASGSAGNSSDAGTEVQGSPSAAALALATQRASAASQLAKRAGIMGVSHVRLQPSPIAAAVQRTSPLEGSSRRTAGANGHSSGTSSAAAAAASSSSSSSSEDSGSSSRGSSNSRINAAARARRSQAAQAAAAVLGLATVPEQVHLAERVGRSRHLFKAAGGHLLHLLQQLQQRVLHPGGLLLWLQQRAHGVAQGASAEGLKGVTTWLALAGVLGCSIGGLMAALAAARPSSDSSSDGSSKPQPAKQQRRRRVLMQQLRHQPSHLLPHWQAYEEAGGAQGRGQPLRLPPGPKGLGVALPIRSKSPEGEVDGAMVPLSHPLTALPGSAAGGGTGGAWAGEVAADFKQLLQPALDRLASSRGSSNSNKAADAASAATAHSKGSSSNSLSGMPALQDLPGGHLRHKASSKKDQGMTTAPAAGASDTAAPGSSEPARQQKIFWFALPASDQVVQHGQGRKGAKVVRQQKSAVVTQVTTEVQERLQPALKRLAATRQA